jgi:Ca2+-binding EF-hand superfamily protein
MAAQTQVSEQRLDWMLATLLEKITERGGSVSNRVKTLLTRFDLDNSGELEMDEFRSCLEDFLAGLQDCEFEALAQRFDSDGSGSVSIPEFTEELKRLAREKEENGGFPPARPPPTQKTTSTRRPRACGLRKTDPSEFEGYGDGVSFSGNSKAPTPTAALDVFFDELRAKAKTLALQSSLREDGIDRKLLQRSLERQRSTPSASHLTAAQFEVALAPFGGVFDEENCLPARVWAACNNGNIEDILSRFKKGNALRARNDVPREVLKLRTLLLDKFVGMGGPLRLAVRDQLTKYDGDGSGELDRAECAKAFSGLVPGIEEKQVNLLVDDIDADGSQTLTVDEIEGYLLAAQTARDPQSTSLGLKPKKPFYTAEGARGL